jgi:hypothetical protein
MLFDTWRQKIDKINKYSNIIELEQHLNVVLSLSSHKKLQTRQLKIQPPSMRAKEPSSY